MPGRAGNAGIFQRQQKLLVSGSGAGQNGNVCGTDGGAVVQPAIPQQTADLGGDPAVLGWDGVVVGVGLSGRAEGDGNRCRILGGRLAADQVIGRNIAD